MIQTTILIFFQHCAVSQTRIFFYFFKRFVIIFGKTKTLVFVWASQKKFVFIYIR